MYVFILQQDNTQNIKPEVQQGSEALTAARNKKCLEQILATTHNMTETKHNKNSSEEVILQLVRSKCISSLLYGLEACALTKSELSSLQGGPN